ncbi:hypothetical protein [Sphingomonas sp.]|uniref:hypothetical protein n=1 Tax=Sphingomonas sp. TaxID=28214 RepID=UPI001D33346D|nr:hypothetical protein [Sphingomonas sp.]MBX9795729.1 hypothetical protein [Sphingomonas sp.]
MGLTVAVGLSAQNLAEAEEDEELLNEPFNHLNEVLVANGLAHHNEPRTVPHGEYFEAQMWGYNSLHALRRLAAYLSMERRLPQPTQYGTHNEDPVYIKFNRLHEQYIENPKSKGIMGIFKKRVAPPPYQHLIMHSDAEGFYVPQSFDEVIVDWTQPQRPGLGMMIGSSAKLLVECEALAKYLNLPAGFEPESDEFLDILESPPGSGEPWQVLAVEAHAVANLTRAAHASLKLGAAIQFC